LIEINKWILKATVIYYSVHPKLLSPTQLSRIYHIRLELNRTLVKIVYSDACGTSSRSGITMGRMDNTQKALIISVSMGYGHQRTAYALKNLAIDGKIINANDYTGIPASDKNIWESMRGFYEFVSDFKRVPIIGNVVFSLVDFFQRILKFYPIRDLSAPNFPLRRLFSFIKGGWGRDLIERNIHQGVPLITTFITPALMAENFGYPGEIYCVVCDADISRAWVSLTPKVSKIKYFAPNARTVERLKCYGVKEDNIYLTGYPIPQEMIGSEQMEILTNDFRNRLFNLDPQKNYFKNYGVLAENKLGFLAEKSDHPLTILFSIGGAGAQKEIAIKIVESLKEIMRSGKIKIILSAGIKKKVKDYFEKELFDKPDFNAIKENIFILYQPNIQDYFKEFNEKLRKTDILWTKPSELSFYSALGIPIIIAPTIGSQEEFNKRWLLKSGFGIFQEDPAYTCQWLFDWLNKGYLAEVAMHAFIEGEQLGTYTIQKIVSKCSGTQ